MGLSANPSIRLRAESDELTGSDPKQVLLRELSGGGSGRAIVFRYRSSVNRIMADGVELVSGERLAAGLVVTAIGYQAQGAPGLPFDPHSGCVPNADGRVLDPATGAPLPRTYVAGWIKRGPTGFIGTDRRCAQDPWLRSSTITTPADSSRSRPSRRWHDLNDLPSAAKRCAERNGLQRRGRDSNPRYVGYTHNGFRDSRCPC